MPILITAKPAKDLQAGEVMPIIATEAGVGSEVPAWVSQNGNELVESSDEGDVLKFHVRKK